ncbi:MAG: VPLPA-CTERM sorting domain-containing protein [Rhodobacteraceae bacterium]|nr:MAG: VPLPA-CTERM sorting domain-containing protein [Paracoccaceae bacterium]
MPTKVCLQRFASLSLGNRITKKRSLLAASLVVATAVIPHASIAATLSVIGDAVTVTRDFGDPDAPEPTPAGNPLRDLGALTIEFFDSNTKNNTNGLSVSGPAFATFTYIGSFAAFNNRFKAPSFQDLLFSTSNFSSENVTATPIGASGTVAVEGGLIPFFFRNRTQNRFISNAGGATSSDPGVALGFSRISDTAFFLLFDDSGGTPAPDRDFRDMVVRVDVAPIPLPAGVWLMLTGVGGLIAAGRRKRAA